MTLVKHNYRSANDLLNEFFNTLPSAVEKETGLNIPPVNIHESNDTFQLELLAPGLNKEDFKVNFEKGLLTISYEKKVETENKDYKTYRREFNFTSFKRSFSIADKINDDNIEAKYTNGILKLILPKKEEVKVTPKEISIQ